MTTTPKPILSIVSGTFQRIRYLQAMVYSARAALPPGIAYEIVLVDGGSTDGTIQWCREQPDIRLIEHGALFGALRAFGDGARVADGDYVLLANDDITFHHESILAALVFLETHPTCGAVAFADDRPAPGYGEGYKVQTIRALAPDTGDPIDVPYAQVGLFRAWLGHHIGWWGDQDGVMGQGHTYGGDAWLSARLWELGYTVDAVDGARVHDLIPADALRTRNHEAEQRNPGVYYKAYPEGVPLAAAPQIEFPRPERLRVLYLPIYEPGFGHYKRGLRDAMSQHFLVAEYDYVNDRAFDLVSAVTLFQPHLLLMQLHGTQAVTPAVLADARAVKPDMVVVNWNGDTYREHLVSPDMLAILRHVDLQGVVNAGVLDTYTAHGIPAAYWQIGFEPVPETLPQVHAHDVVFLANAYSAERTALGGMLKALPYDVGLYGYGWPDGDGNTLYAFAIGAALYRAAKVAIGDNQYPDDTGFVSNRLFESLANGAFLLHQRIEGLEGLTGLVDGVHYISWTNTKDLKAKLKYWLADERGDERRAIAAAGEAYVRAHHSFDARVRELLTELLPNVKPQSEGTAR